MTAAPIHDGEGLMAAGVVTVQGKFALRMQSISSHRMLECKICMSMDNLWKEKTTISHWGVSCSAGDWGHLDNLVRGDLCALFFVADTWKQLLLPQSAVTADAHPQGRSFRQLFPSWRQSLCAPFLEVAQLLSRQKKNASCSLPWEDQVEYDPEILPSLCFTIIVKIWSGEAAVKLLISTLMTTSTFLRFHFDLHGPAESAVKL